MPYNEKMSEFYLAVIAIIISIFSAIIALSHFVFNSYSYRAKLKLERASNATKLHERWWSKEYYESRHKVWELIESWKKGEEKGLNFLAYYSNPDFSNRPDELEDFAKIVFFFSDVNVFLEKGLIEEDLADRLFGVAQYDWFKDYITEARERIEKREQSKNLVPRWVFETKSLESKLYKIQVLDN